VGIKINEFRKSIGISLEDFAGTLGYSISYVTKIIYGQREPSRSFFKRLKEKYPSIDLNYFF